MNYPSKCITTLVTVAAILPLARPASGEEGKRLSGKELTLIHSRNCIDLTGTLRSKIEKLREEISQGRRIYTPDEIRKLELKLKETDELMDVMMYSPGD